jgi:hypothetical protein
MKLTRRPIVPKSDEGYYCVTDRREAVAMKPKQRLCRICKQRPIWTHGDVKDPGPVCKRCYHKHVWPERKAAARATPPADPIDESQSR